MEAIATAPVHSTFKYYIHVEAGLYRERVEFITFENSAGYSSQAVAVTSFSNQSAFFQCTFLGYQDTLHAKSGWHFYRECNIYGTVDFVFGAAATIFQSCNLFSRLPQTITFIAQNKQDAHRNSGYVIQNCTLTVAPGMERQKPLFKAYLGRPWSNLSTVVVIESYLDDIIQPTGWLSWGNTSTDKLTYYEFRNHGPGAPTDKRVHWRGYKAINQANMVRDFTVARFISDDDWLPGTDIPFIRGFISD
ncbi:UNVERIFIED_CONTAM: Pectinesterase 2 [Sesamum radiatum]|uniref:Pectinesterase n=1 Tax=Sesamum radiatum TaxID=300843 RepID=A0AAW2TUG9_SESRA